MQEKVVWVMGLFISSCFWQLTPPRPGGPGGPGGPGSPGWPGIPSLPGGPEGPYKKRRNRWSDSVVPMRVTCWTVTPTRSGFVPLIWLTMTTLITSSHLICVYHISLPVCVLMGSRSWNPMKAAPLTVYSTSTLTMWPTRKILKVMWHQDKGTE